MSSLIPSCSPLHSTSVTSTEHTDLLIQNCNTHLWERTGNICLSMLELSTSVESPSFIYLLTNLILLSLYTNKILLCMYQIFCTHASVNGHLGWFHVLAISCPSMWREKRWVCISVTGYRILPVYARSKIAWLFIHHLYRYICMYIKYCYLFIAFSRMSRFIFIVAVLSTRPLHTITHPSTVN